MITGLTSAELIGRAVSGVTITISSVFVFCVSRLLNSAPRMGMCASPGSFDRLSVHPVVDQPGDHEALPFAQLDVGLHAPRGESGNREPGHRHPVGHIDGGDLRLHVHLMVWCAVISG